MKLPRYAGVVPPSLDFLRVSELENLMRKTQEGDSPPKQPKIKNYLTKLDKWFIVSMPTCLVAGRRTYFEIHLKAIESYNTLLNCKDIINH